MPKIKLAMMKELVYRHLQRVIRTLPMYRYQEVFYLEGINLATYYWTLREFI